MPETSNRLVRVLSAAVNGLETTPVQIEISTSTGKDFFMVGLPDSAVRESRTRVQSALRNTGFRLALRNTVVNFAPADVRKEGTAYDLPLALGLLGAYDYVQTERFGRYMFVGELGLDGSLRPVRGALPSPSWPAAQATRGSSCRTRTYAKPVWSTVWLSTELRR